MRNPPATHRSLAFRAYQARFLASFLQSLWGKPFEEAAVTSQWTFRRSNRSHRGSIPVHKKSISITEDINPCNSYYWQGSTPGVHIRQDQRSCVQIGSNKFNLLRPFNDKKSTKISNAFQTRNKTIKQHHPNPMETQQSHTTHTNLDFEEKALKSK
ncbi:hypothetical protein ROZALSC1DRAFT_25750, partial [Rozella allomycis CSF55]